MSWARTIVIASATIGCGGAPPVVATFPNCPVPVLLSKIDRVGAKTAPATTPTGVYDHFSTRLESTRTSESHREYEYAYTERNLDTGEERDFYNESLAVSGGNSADSPRLLTNRVRNLVPNATDARATDIVIDHLDVTVDFTIIGTPNAGAGVQRLIIDTHAHKVWVK